MAELQEHGDQEVVDTVEAVNPVIVPIRNNWEQVESWD